MLWNGHEAYKVLGHMPIPRFLNQTNAAGSNSIIVPSFKARASGGHGR